MSNTPGKRKKKNQIGVMKFKISIWKEGQNGNLRSAFFFFFFLSYFVLLSVVVAKTAEGHEEAQFLLQRVVDFRAKPAVGCENTLGNVKT